MSNYNLVHPIRNVNRTLFEQRFVYSAHVEATEYVRATQWSNSRGSDYLLEIVNGWREMIVSTVDANGSSVEVMVKTS